MRVSLDVVKITSDFGESLLASIWDNLHCELKVLVWASKCQAALEPGEGEGTAAAGYFPSAPGTRLGMEGPADGPSQL